MDLNRLKAVDLNQKDDLACLKVYSRVHISDLANSLIVLLTWEE